LVCVLSKTIRNKISISTVPQKLCEITKAALPWSHSRFLSLSE
jgi:hypothetical protein